MEQKWANYYYYFEILPNCVGSNTLLSSMDYQVFLEMHILDTANSCSTALHGHFLQPPTLLEGACRNSRRGRCCDPPASIAPTTGFPAHGDPNVAQSEIHCNL